MSYLVVLAAFSLAIAFLGWRIWKKTRQISFLIGIALLYYWSLYGAWSVITDKLGGDSGMRYGYLEISLFSLALDDDYLYSLLLYSLFIITVQVVLLQLVKTPTFSSTSRLSAVQVSHSRILVVACVAGGLSFMIASDSIAAAAALNLAAYTETRPETGSVSALFTLHQVLLRIAVMSAVVGFVVLQSGKAPRLLASRQQRWLPLMYLTVLATLCGFCFVLGNKNELLFAGLAGGLQYMANCRKPRILLVAVVGACATVALGLMDLLRGVPLLDLAEEVEGISPAQVGEAVTAVMSSNEAFGAHFSMYGVLSHHIAPTFGTSFVWLAASVIPHILWAGRPDPVYLYYAERVGADPGHGYALLHATGWYLNFGSLGVIAGGILLGWIWAKSFNAHLGIRSCKASWGYAFRVLAPWTFVAYMPSLARGGIEAYKGVALEAFLLPVAVLALAFVKAPVPQEKQQRLVALQIGPRVGGIECQ